MKLKFRLPPYRAPRNAWREAISREAIRAGGESLGYKIDDRLEIDVRLYMKAPLLQVHDVDNRLKDILDALQGRMGGSKAVHAHPRIIPNDTVIYRVTIEKKAPPRQSRGLGHVVIRRLPP